MHDKDLLKIKIEEILNRYHDMPVFSITKASFIEEISQEVALFMDEGDGTWEIASVIDEIGFRKWELD